MGWIDALIAQYADLTTTGTAEIPINVLAFAAAYPVLLAGMWPGSLPMARRPRWFSFCGVGTWVYLVGVVLPLCWGAAVNTGG